MTGKRQKSIFSFLLVCIFTVSVTGIVNGTSVSGTINDVVLLINSEKAIINGKLVKMTDNNNPQYTKYQDDKAYLPLKLVRSVLDEDVEDKYLDKTTTIDEVIYVDLEYVADRLNKNYLFDDGLVIITNKKDLSEYEKSMYVFRQQLSPLESVGTKSEFDALIEHIFIQENVSDGSASFATGEAQNSALNSLDNSGSTIGSYSETNVQVTGVSEADIVKTDGEYIYYSSSEKIYIIRAVPESEMEVVSKIDNPLNSYSSELYLHDKLLIVISEGYEDMGIYMYGYSNSAKTMVTIYDITDKSNPKKIRTAEVLGAYRSSRKIGNSLYFISDSNLYGLYQDTEFGDIEYMDSVFSDEPQKLDYSKVFYYPGEAVRNLTSISGICLDDFSKEIEISSFLGVVGNDIYVSESNLYLATTVSPWNIYDRNMIPWDNSVRNSSINTEIYKFSLNEGKATFLNMGIVPGRVLNQFSMDEKDGYLRLATTTGLLDTSNNIYVLNSFMDITGKIEGIAPTEDIYSARFMGDRAYMVTFRRTDPLYTIDLKDPNNPKILGALKIPGYSDYLHPYDENHLIGFGKDTLEYNNTSYYQGMKISMFDVTDIDNPKEMFVEFIGDRGTESEILSNHKALLFSNERNILAFPVMLYEKDKNITTPIAHGNFTFQGAYVYEINPDSGFVLKGRISHLTEDDYSKSGYFYSNQDRYIKRIIYIGDNLYTLSDEIIKVNDIEDLNEGIKINLYD